MEKEVLKDIVRFSETERFARVKPSNLLHQDDGTFRLIAKIYPRTEGFRTGIEVVMYEDNKLDLRTARTLPLKELEVSSAVYRLNKPRYGLPKDTIIVRVTSSQDPYLDLYYTLHGKLLLQHDFSRSKVRGKGTTTRFYRSWRNIFKFFKT